MEGEAYLSEGEAQLTEVEAYIIEGERLRNSAPVGFKVRPMFKTRPGTFFRNITNSRSA